MRNLTKKALSLILCLMLVVSAISCVFSISATTVGYTTVNGNPVYNAPVDLDLADGLDAWLNIGTASSPKVVAEDGVLKAGDGFNTLWDEIGPARFKIPNGEAGDVVRVRYDFKVNLDALTDEALKTRVTGGERVLYVIVRQYDSTGTKITDQQLDLTYNTQGIKVSKGFTLSSSDDFFRIIFCSAKALKDAWEVSDIAVLKRIQEDSKDDTNGALDNPFFDYGGRAYSYYTYVDGPESVGFANFDGSLEGGSEETGYTYTTKTNIAISFADNLAVIEAPKNLDFNSGLKYWASYIAANSADKGTTAADEVASVENGVVTLNAKDRNNAGLTTQKFMTGIKAGEKLYITVEFKPVAGDEEKIIDAKLRFRAYQGGCYKRQGMYYNYNGQSETNLCQQIIDLEGAEIANVAKGSEEGWLRLTASYTAVADDEYYQLAFGYGETEPKVVDEETGAEVTDYSAIAQLQFRNINVFTETEDGKRYVNAQTGNEWTKNPLLQVGGTEEYGIPAIDLDAETAIGNSATFMNSDYSLFNTHVYGINNAFLNNDFSEGFRYWSVYRYVDAIPETANLAGIASVDGDAVTFKALDTTDTSTAVGMISQPFTLDGLEEGDKIYLSVDVSAGANVRIALVENNAQKVDGTWTTHYPASWTFTDFYVDVNNDTDDFMTYTKGITVKDPSNIFTVRISKNDPTAEVTVKGIKLLKGDIGGLEEAPPVNADGTLLDDQVYGDANFDGELNILDIVRMKKHVAEGTGIFFAAVDAVKDGVLDALDFVEVIGWILNK